MITRSSIHMVTDDGLSNDYRIHFIYISQILSSLTLLLLDVCPVTTSTLTEYRNIKSFVRYLCFGTRKFFYPKQPKVCFLTKRFNDKRNPPSEMRKIYNEYVKYH